MPRPRQPIKRDPEPVVRARMRMMPDDQSVILAKMSDGTIVKTIFNGTYSVAKASDGREVLITPGGPMLSDATGRLTPTSIDTSMQRWDSFADEKVRKALTVGVAEQFVFFWVNQSPRRIAEVKAKGYQLVSKKANEVFCPFAFGDQTDDYIHYGDTILCKRPIEIDEREKSDRAYYNDPTKYLQSKEAEMRDEAARLGMKNFEQTVERADKDTVTLGQVE